MIRKFAVAVILTLTFCFAAVNAQEKSPAPIPTPLPETKVSKPSSIGIAVDRSNSFRKVMDYVDHMIQAIVDKIEPDDEVFLLTFVNVDKINIEQDFTSDKDALKSASEDMFVEGGQTAISEALSAAAKHLVEKGKNERKILILISDGDNRSDKKAQADAVLYLKDSKIPVFVVGITAGFEGDARPAQKFLEKLASETGGSLVLVDKQIPYKDVANSLIKAIQAQ